MTNSRSLVLQVFRRGASAALGLALLLGLVAVAGTSSAQTQSYKENVLHSFTFGDGAQPEAGLILDAKGNLYGTTSYGDAFGSGVVFKMSSKGQETALYSFCPANGCKDGSDPNAGVIFDAQGNLYGTTPNGGAYGDGVVFKVSSKGHETVLHSFCPANGCKDGAGPNAGVIFDAQGNLYGTTHNGGAYGDGVVFKVSSKGHETVLHSFTGGADGANPAAGLIFDAKGNLYGTTWTGGASNDGVAFKVSSKGHETVLHSFTGGADGANPAAGLIFDAKGNLYGTTSTGGASNDGVVFKVSSKGHETVIHSFTGGADGANPPGGLGLILDAKGNFYGTTWTGGAYGFGVVFKVSSKGQETVLYSFCPANGCKDGAGPDAGLILDAKGNLYGTTYGGGAYGFGTVFKLTP